MFNMVKGSIYYCREDGSVVELEKEQPTERNGRRTLQNFKFLLPIKKA